MKLRQLRNGDYFKLVRNGVVGSCVYIRGDYDKGSKRFLVFEFWNVRNARFFKGDTEVTTAKAVFGLRVLGRYERVLFKGRYRSDYRFEF